MKSMNSKAELFLKTFKDTFDKKYNTPLISFKDIGILCPTLILGNGGDWCRKNTRLCKDYKIVTIKNNNTVNYLFDASEDERKQMEEEIKKLKKGKGNTLKYIKFMGKNVVQTNSVSIPQEVRSFFNEKKYSCSVCSTRQDIEIDHRNGKDKSLPEGCSGLDSLEYFQPLCKHCNDVKRERCKRCINNGEQHYPTDVEDLCKELGIEKKQNCKDCYWYSCSEFRIKHILLNLKNNSTKDKMSTSKSDHKTIQSPSTIDETITVRRPPVRRPPQTSSVLKTQIPKILDLFSGCGGLLNGLIQSGLDVKVSNEFWKPAHDTNKLNHPNTKHILGDITDVSIKRQIIEECKKVGVNVITGGPPCQAYSNAGNKDQFDSRGQLYKYYIGLVKEIKPDICIMENVTGILSINHLKDDLSEEEKSLVDDYVEIKKKYDEETDEKNKKKIQLLLNKSKSLVEKNCNEPVIDKIKRGFIELGYNIEHKVLNSADFGCPQRRNRVIFIATKPGLIIEYPVETHSQNGDNNKLKWTTVRDAIDDIKDLSEDKHFSHIYSKHTPQMVERMEKTEFEKSVQEKYKEAYYKCHPDKPSLTVKENHGGVFVHYEKPRCMTPRELARLQTFKDDFIFTGSKKDILVQIGNAVPCQLGKHIGYTISKIFN